MVRGRAWPSARRRSPINQHRARSALGYSARAAGAPARITRQTIRKAPAAYRVQMAPRGGMRARRAALAAALVVALLATCFPAHAQPPTADESIASDRTFRQAAVKAGRNVATTPKFGFFGTIFHLILEQINDTKSAYNQISDLVGNQFTDDNAITVEPDLANNGTTETPKISRAEFLKILDRNLKGLARLRNLEWREARKDSWTNLRGYKEELFGGKKPRNRR